MPDVPELGDFGNIESTENEDRFTAAVWQPEDGESNDIKDLDKRARAAVLAYDAALEAFDRDKERAWKERRQQSRVLGRELDRSYNIMDKLVAKLSWARGSVARQRGSSSCADACCAPAQFNTLSKKVRFCSSFQGPP